MPCNSDYMYPTREEIIGSQVETFLDEVEGGVVNREWLLGYHPKVYNMGYNKAQLDAATAKLCKLLTMGDNDVTKYSLELQLWLRDHKEADRAREVREADQHKRQQQRISGLSKLTKEEKEALGLK